MKWRKISDEEVTRDRVTRQKGARHVGQLILSLEKTNEVSMANVQNIEQEISQLPKERQWELLNYLLQHFSPKSEHQKNDLPWSSSVGLGKEVWNSVDAQDYVNQMRSER